MSDTCNNCPLLNDKIEYFCFRCNRVQLTLVCDVCGKQMTPSSFNLRELDRLRKQRDELQARHQKLLNEAQELQQYNADIRHELSDLKAKLPKTEDGVCIYPHMRVWCLFSDGIHAGYATGKAGGSRAEVEYDDEIDLSFGVNIMSKISDPSLSSIYSTEQAAREAGEEK